MGSIGLAELVVLGAIFGGLIAVVGVVAGLAITTRRGPRRR